ncbi:right-handed parallel beta-helix repeat-containing protein [Treponema sp. OttesenSCG-928-L16]|nr:right-handed parallel beta-helix repeat-containing protein [Treponema sp. OttesenSCG-928-L16]
MTAGTISYNTTTASSGGGVDASINASGDSIVNISGGTICYNEASGSGGGIVIVSSSTVIENCTIWGNSAATDGGGIQILGAYSPTIKNCTISENTALAGSGGGISISSPFRDIGNPKIYGCIIVGNTGSGGRDEFFSDDDVVYTESDNLIDSVIDPDDVFIDSAPADNGGPTKTLMIDKTNNDTKLTVSSISGWTLPEKDQRGYTRGAVTTYKGAVDPDGTEPPPSP